jgi:hypothetical protein
MRCYCTALLAQQHAGRHLQPGDVNAARPVAYGCYDIAIADFNNLFITSTLIVGASDVVNTLVCVSSSHWSVGRVLSLASSSSATHVQSACKSPQTEGGSRPAADWRQCQCILHADSPGSRHIYLFRRIKGEQQVEGELSVSPPLTLRCCIQAASGRCLPCSLLLTWPLFLILQAAFISSYLHSSLIFAVALAFSYTVYTSADDPIGTIDNVWRNLNIRSEVRTVIRLHCRVTHDVLLANLHQSRTTHRLLALTKLFRTTHSIWHTGCTG